MENPWKTHGISLHQFGRHHDFDQIQGVLQPGEPGIIREFEKKLWKIRENYPQ